MSQFYIVSVKHTLKTCDYILLWKPEAKGYTYSLERAGKFSREEVMGELSSYNNGTYTVAIPCEVLEHLSTTSENPEIIPGRVVMHIKAHWDELLKHTIEKPKNKPAVNYKKVWKYA